MYAAVCSMHMYALIAAYFGFGSGFLFFKGTLFQTLGLWPPGQKSEGPA